MPRSVPSAKSHPCVHISGDSRGGERVPSRQKGSHPSSISLGPSVLQDAWFGKPRQEQRLREGEAPRDPSRTCFAADSNSPSPELLGFYSRSSRDRQLLRRHHFGVSSVCITAHQQRPRQLLMSNKDTKPLCGTQTLGKINQRGLCKVQAPAGEQHRILQLGTPAAIGTTPSPRQHSPGTALTY